MHAVKTNEWQENLLGFILWYFNAIVDDCNDQHPLPCRDFHLYEWLWIFPGIVEHVADNLGERLTVSLQHDVILFQIEGDQLMQIIDGRFKPIDNVGHQLANIEAGKTECHNIWVYFTEIKQLIGQIEQTLAVLVNGIDISLYLRIIHFLLCDALHWTIN